MTALNFHLTAWQQQYDAIHQYLEEDETLSDYRGNNPLYQTLNKGLHIRRRTVIQTVNDKQNIAVAVTGMMDLGTDSTPSTDSCLTGLTLILFLPGHPAEKYKEEFYPGLQRSRNNTMLLSAITLETALRQHCRENIRRFAHNTTYDIPGNAAQAIEKIKHIGSSSGCDMLYSMADSYVLNQTHGGNYVG